MKNLIGALVLVIVSVLISVGATLVMSSNGMLPSNMSEEDSLKVATIAEKVAFPQFTDADEYLQNAKSDADVVKALSVMSTMEPNTIAIIADKAIKQFGYVDYTTFINTYETSKDVYDSANQTLAEKNAELNAADQSTPPIDDTQNRVVEKDSIKPYKGVTIHINGD